MMDDELLARELQEEYDREAAELIEQYDEPGHMNLGKQKPQENNGYKSHSFSYLSPVDPSLEFSDPNPDIRVLFLQFNEAYFWGSLSGIEVKWSPRMTLCAGLCVYEGFGGLCSVRLSLPLLKLRPRKDLVETLLHEMIHAYLFITNNDRDHDGHGPTFQKHMRRINKATGANITIYHTFHDEVEAYQQHWWRCDGPCQRRKPFFGYVKRAMNRAPSSNDFWWAEHKATCGGTFTKIKEPEDYGKKKAGGTKSQEKNDGKDIQTYMKKGQVSSPLKKLFDVTGKAPSFDKRNSFHGGSVFSKEKTKNSSSAKSKTSSTSNFVLSGGVLIRKPSLKQSSLFSSVGISNSVVSTNNLSHSMLPPKDRINNSVSILDVRKQERNSFHNDTSMTEASDEEIKFADIFCGLGKKSHKWQCHTQSSPTLDQNKKHIKLPKNFFSVCEGKRKGKAEKRKRKKYIFDELDDDNGLWDRESALDPSKSYTEKREGKTDNHLSSLSPLNKKLKDTCKIANQETSSSPKVNRDILTEICPRKLDDQISPSGHHLNSHALSKLDSHFPVQGYKLGGGQHSKSVTSTKYEIHSLQAVNSSKKLQTLDSFISKGKKVPDIKRSFDSAFALTVIDISDEDEGEDFEPQAHKKVKEEPHEKLDTQEFTDYENNVPSASASVSGTCGQSSSSGRDENSSLITCPVCNTKVFHYGINTHLDICLGFT